MAMPPDFSMIPREELRLIHIDGDFKITTFPAPPSPHDPDEYCRLHPRRRTEWVEGRSGGRAL